MSKELSNIEQPFEVEVYGEVTLLRLHLEGGLLAIDLEQIGQLWQFLDQQKKRPSKVLLCLGPSGFLAPGLVDQVWNKKVANEMDVMRFLNGIHRFVIEIQKIDSFVIGALSGEIDFSFVGAALACDYRISANDTVFLNRFLDSGLPPCGGVPWFLTRFFGHEKTART